MPYVLGFGEPAHHEAPHALDRIARPAILQREDFHAVEIGPLPVEFFHGVPIRPTVMRPVVRLGQRAHHQAVHGRGVVGVLPERRLHAHMLAEPEVRHHVELAEVEREAHVLLYRAVTTVDIKRCVSAPPRLIPVAIDAARVFLVPVL